MSIVIGRDLRAMFGPVRNQGSRPTCLAFAASDFHAALRPGWMPLSAEFAFYHAQRRGHGSPHSGATLASMFEAIEKDGQPVEADWPYLAAVPTNLKLWVPPKTIGALYRRKGDKYGNSFNEIIALLDSDLPGLILINLSDSFYAPRSDGLVTPSPGEGPDPMRRHAVVAVAHGTAHGERIVLVRNSWGPAWGMAGHAWLAEAYLKPRLTRVAALTEDPSVSTH